MRVQAYLTRVSCHAACVRAGYNHCLPSLGRPHALRVHHPAPAQAGQCLVVACIAAHIHGRRVERVKRRAQYGQIFGSAISQRK